VTEASASPLITPGELAVLLAGDQPPALLDVRWRLGGPPGRELYRAGHLPGAVFTDLDRDLAAPPGAGGRHPVPAAADFQAAMRRVGLGANLEQVDGCDQWTAPELRIESGGATVLAGVDGEAMELPAPLVVRIVAGGLRVVVPLGTPASPAATDRLLSIQALGSLAEIAGGVESGPFGEDA